MKANPNSRITIESLSASETVPFLGIHKTDFKVLFALPVALLITGILADSVLVGIGSGAVAFVFCAGIVFVTPSYMTSMQYLRALREYLRRPKELLYTSNPDMDPDSYFERIEEEQTTTELTHVQRYYDRGVIEREDGKLLAAVRLEPQSMDFAQGDEWAAVTRTTEEFANNALDFDCQFYVTSRRFPVESYTNELEARLEDEDIASLPMMRATLKELIQERPKELEEANLAPLHFYAIVSVGEGEVVTDTTADTSALEKLSNIGGLGIAFSIFASMRDNLDELHTRARMLRKLDERVSTLENGLVRNIEGYDSSRVSTAEWVLTLEDYWKSQTMDFNQFEGVADSAPIVGGNEVEVLREQLEREQRTDETWSSDTEDTLEIDTSVDENENEEDEEGEFGGNSLEEEIYDSEFQFQSEPDELEPPSTQSTDEDGDETGEDGEPAGSENAGNDDDSEEAELSGIRGWIVKALIGDGTNGEDSNTEAESASTTSSSGHSAPTTESERQDADDDGEETGDGSIGVLSRVKQIVFRRGESDRDPEPVTDESTAPDPGSVKAEALADVDLPEKSELQQLSLAAEDIEKRFRSVIVEEQEYRQVLFVESWPKNLSVGSLRELFTRSSLNIDLSIHIRPKDREQALSRAERRVQSLQTDASTGLSGFAARDKLEEAEEAEIVRDQLDGGQTPAKVSLYVVVRADSEEHLREEVRAVRDIFRDAPANMGLKTLSGNQLPGLQSCSPVGKDVVNKDADFDTDQLLLGQGIGCLLSSFKQSTLLEKGGIEFGEHAFNSTPIIKDPFSSETNYNWTVIGDSGSGKSYQSKQMALRTKMAREDTKLIILDPLEGFFGLSKAMNAEHITIGGDQGLNPLEIRPPADHTTEADDIDPLSQKIKDVMSFFENFAARQGYDFGSKRPILSTAVKAAYEQQGITHDVGTHHKHSPTIHEVLNVLKNMAEHPQNYVIRSETEEASISDKATDLIGYLRPFVNGAFQNLAKPSEFDLAGEDVVYLDLSQQEHTSSGGGIMMQLLFSLVYERAKETPKNVIFLIDEARFLMRDAQNLEFLGQRVRHSRHYDTSIRFITQNIGDFFSHEEAESIINNSFINIFHQTEEIQQWADTFGLNQQETQFVKNAQTGKHGYSEALVSIDNTRYPIQFFATDSESAIIDFDPRRQTSDVLPGTEEDVSELSKEIRGTLEELYGNFEQEFGADKAELEAIYEDLPPTHQRYLSVLDDHEFYQALDLVRTGDDESAMVAAAVNEKIGELFGSVDQEGLTQRLQTVADDYYARQDSNTTTNEPDDTHQSRRQPAQPEMDD
jgi:hypothetical protein